jgi:hypothetical protein
MYVPRYSNSRNDSFVMQYHNEKGHTGLRTDGAGIARNACAAFRTLLFHAANRICAFTEKEGEVLFDEANP